MVIETWQGGRHNFPKVTPKNPRKGPPPFITTVTLGAGDARPLHLRRPRHAVEHDRAPDLTVQLVKNPIDNNYLGRATFSNGIVQIMDYQPFARGHAVAVQDAGRQGPASITSISTATAPGRRSPATSIWAVAGTALSGPIQDRLPDAEGHLLPRPEVQRLRHGRFHRHVPPLQGRPRAEGHVRRAPVAGVNAVAVPEPARLGPVAARSPGDHRRHERALRRHGAVRLPDGAARVAARPTQATWIVDYKDVDLAQLTDFLETEGLRLAGRASGTNRLEWPLGKWAQKRGGGAVTVEPPRARADRGAQSRRRADAQLAGPGRSRARSTRGCRSATCRSPGSVEYALDPEWIHLRPELGRDRADLRRVRRPDRVRPAIPDPIPRHQPRLAGERSSARRDHDRVRRADRRRAGGRIRRVRRRAARRVHASRASRDACAPSGCGPGTSSGARAAPTSRSRTATSSSRTRDDDGRRRDPRRRPVLARLPAPGRRRRD